MENRTAPDTKSGSSSPLNPVLLAVCHDEQHIRAGSDSKGSCQQVYASLGAKTVQFLSNRGVLWIDRVCGSLLVALGLALTFLKRAV